MFRRRRRRREGKKCRRLRGASVLVVDARVDSRRRKRRQGALNVASSSLRGHHLLARRLTPFAVKSRNLRDAAWTVVCLGAAVNARARGESEARSVVVVVATLEKRTQARPRGEDGVSRARRRRALRLEIFHRARGFLFRSHARVPSRWSGDEGHLHARVPRVAAFVAEKRIRVFVIDVATVSALVRVLATVSADAVSVRHVSAAPRALQRLLRFRVQADVERGELHDDAGEDERRRKFRRRLRRPRRKFNRRHAKPQRTIPAKASHVHPRVSAPVNHRASNLHRPTRSVRRHDDRFDGRTRRQSRRECAIRVPNLPPRRVQLGATIPLVVRILPRVRPHADVSSRATFRSRARLRVGVVRGARSRRGLEVEPVVVRGRSRGGVRFRVWMRRGGANRPRQRLRRRARARRRDHLRHGIIHAVPGRTQHPPREFERLGGAFASRRRRQ